MPATMTPHFQRREFECPHCGVSLVRDRLTECLEKLRAHVGHPIRIVSGYRCPVHNKAVGGAPNSMHMYGAAADIPAGLCSASVAAHAGFVGVGTKGDWAVHVDVRDGPPARWTY